MSNINIVSKKTLGCKGESFVLDKLKTKGYLLYKKNFIKWGIELDLIVYKYIPEKKMLDIRVVEVKTRSLYEFNLANLKLDRKWYRLIGYLFDIKDVVTGSVDYPVKYSEIHFDLALVKSGQGNDLIMCSYINDINLLF